MEIGAVEVMASTALASAVDVALMAGALENTIEAGRRPIFPYSSDRLCALY